MPTTPAGLVVPISREERLRSMNARRAKMESGHQNAQSKALEKELRGLDDRLRVIFVDPAAGQLPPAFPCCFKAPAGSMCYPPTVSRA